MIVRNVQDSSWIVFKLLLTVVFATFQWVVTVSVVLIQHIPNFVTTIHTMGHRVVVGDVQDSFHFVRYRRQENQLIVFADDTNPRWITCSTLLDYNTVAGADKFGNVFVVSMRIILYDAMCLPRRWLKSHVYNISSTV